MATILEFRSGAQSREQQSEPCAHAGAEIIIFPGVRYERWDNAAPAEVPCDADEVIDVNPKPQRRAAASGRSATAARKKPRAERKRDILEIPD